MTGSDDEFEDFLRRRKPVFRTPADDDLEPPEELDRIVLGKAREAIESPRPMRLFRAPRWSAPVALAATVVLGFTFVLHQGAPQTRVVPEVQVQNIAQPVAERTEFPAAAPLPPPPREVDATSGPVVVELSPPVMAKSESVLADTAAAPTAGSGLVAREEAERYAAPPPPAPAAVHRAADARMDTAVVVSAPAAPSTEVPTFRRDTKTWLAEIDRLRASGDTASADAELAELKRQQRAYAVSPDR